MNKHMSDRLGMYFAKLTSGQIAGLLWDHQLTFEECRTDGMSATESKHKADTRLVLHASTMANNADVLNKLHK